MITKRQDKENEITLKSGYVLDYLTGRPVNITKPEEKVRQEYEKSLHEEYHYPKDFCEIEVSIQMGVATKKADIVIYKSNNQLERNQNRDIYCIVETKKPNKKDGVSQLCSYMSATSAEFGVWTNGEEIEYLFKDKHTGTIQEKYIYQIPKFSQKLEDLDRITKDKLEPAKNLKAIFRRIHRTLYSNTNISRKEKLGSELMRLIFCKIHDELYNSNDIPKFRVGINEEPESVKKRIVSIWNDLKEDLINDGIFEKHETIVIDPESIVYIVGELENYSLTKTDKDVVGAAFEIFAEKQFVGEKGEFFTPRPMVKMCVDILDPQPHETVIDPACGSGGFLIYALEHVWNKMDSDPKYKNSPKLHDFKRDIAQKNFYGIDKEIDLVKISKAYMQIIGDGKSNIVCTDSLKMPHDWTSDIAKNTMTKDGNLKQFDIIITNPPFGSKIKVKHKHILEQYELGYKYDKNNQKTTSTKKTDPQVLFIELCFNLLKEGGRMAIVLPDGIFGNPTDEYIRQFIKQRGEILAVVDCHHTSFMPHTHTKTSVLIIKKWKNNKTLNYPILMSIIKKCGHDNRGKDIFIKDEYGNEILDEEFSRFTKIYKDNQSRVIKGYDRKGFTIYESELINDILIPGYYNPETKKAIKEIEDTNKYELKTIDTLIKDGVISIKGAGGTASSNEYSIFDNIPFLRTSDLGVFETRNVAVQNVNEETYLKYKDKQKLEIGDILFVKDGTYRIGENIILTQYDLKMLIQSHFLIIRTLKKDILNPYLLFYLINQEIVKKQIEEKTFVQATLSTIGNRIKEVVLPIPKDQEDQNRIIKKMQYIIETRRDLRNDINNLFNFY